MSWPAKSRRLTQKREPPDGCQGKHNAAELLASKLMAVKGYSRLHSSHSQRVLISNSGLDLVNTSNRPPFLTVLLIARPRHHKRVMIYSFTIPAFATNQGPLVLAVEK